MSMEYEDPIVSDVISGNDLVLSVSEKYGTPKKQLLLFAEGEGEEEEPLPFDPDDPVTGGGSTNGEHS